MNEHPRDEHRGRRPERDLREVSTVRVHLIPLVRHVEGDDAGRNRERERPGTLSETAASGEERRNGWKDEGRGEAHAEAPARGNEKRPACREGLPAGRRPRTNSPGKEQHGPDHERRGEHLPVDGIPAERTLVGWRRTPQRRPEAGKPWTVRDAPDELEEEEDV